MIVTILFNGFWQGALVVAGTTALLRCRVTSAATRYAAWFCALLAVCVVPAATAKFHWGAAILMALQGDAGTHRSIFSLIPLRAASFAASRPPHILDGLYGAHVLAAVGLAWLLGAAAGLLRLTVSLCRIARIRREAAQFSHAGAIPVLTSDAVSIPIAAGFLAPVIVLPRQLAQNLTAEQLTCTIEHELAHIRRGDVATNFVQRIIEALFFWNPWIHLAGRKLVRERECASDDFAARRIGDAAEYASCLAALARLVTSATTALLTPSAFASRHALVDRIERLMSNRPRNGSSLNYVTLGALPMFFAAMTLMIQAFIPAPIAAAPLGGATHATMIAANGACKTPNAEPTAIDAVAPDLPKSEMPSRKVSAVVAVTVGTNGSATAARVYRSSGYPNVDRAVVAAAQKSKYSPKLVDCTPVQSTYLFKADFAP